MKRHNFNKFLTLFGVLLVLGISSCIKDFRAGETNLNNLKPTANIVEGGLYQFGTQALLFDPTDPSDTALFHVNYAGVSTAPQDENFTLGVDAGALTSYNAQSGGAPYILLPDSCFSFSSTSVVVSKGQTYSDSIPVVFYPGKIDPTQNYMLPISIMKAPAGITISSNVGTVYYHFIGNPIAGPYSWDWTRFNAPDTTGTPSPTSFTGNPTTFSPDDPTTVEVPSGYYNHARYVITFADTSGVLSNFAVSFNPTDLAGFAPAVTLTSGPTILTADPINHIYRFIYTVSTASGPRTLIDKFYK